MDWNHWLLFPLLRALAVGLGSTVLSLPDHAEGLQKLVAAKTCKHILGEKCGNFALGGNYLLHQSVCHVFWTEPGLFRDQPIASRGGEDQWQ